MTSRYSATGQFTYLGPSTLVASVDAGPRPWGIAISADGTTLYTANGSSNDVSVIDIATRQVTKKIPAGRGPWGIALVKRAAVSR